MKTLKYLLAAAASFMMLGGLAAETVGTTPSILKEGGCRYSVSWEGQDFRLRDVHPEIRINDEWVSVSDFKDIVWKSVDMPRLSYSGTGDQQGITMLQMVCTGHPQISSFILNFELGEDRPYVVMNATLQAEETFKLGGIRLFTADKTDVHVKGGREDWIIYNQNIELSAMDVLCYPDQLGTKKTRIPKQPNGSGVWVSMLANDGLDASFCMASISGELWPNIFLWKYVGNKKGIQLNLTAQSSGARELEQIWVPAGKTINTDAFLMGYWKGVRPTAVLAEVGKIMGENVRKGKPMHCPEMGWSSWHTYCRSRLSAEAVTRTADFIADNLSDYGYKNIQLDGGWWTFQGLYSVNDRFSRGIRDLSNHLKDKGMDFGLHVSPLRTNASAPFLKVLPEIELDPYWTPVADPKGEEYKTTIGATYYDTSHPFVAPYLAGQFQQMIEDYRPVFMKWDHHYGALEEGHRYDSTMTFLQGQNRAIRMIRSVLPEDLIITKSMGFMFGALECYDAARISNDINSPGWKSEEEPYANMTWGKTTGDLRDLPQEKGIIRHARSVAQNFYVHKNIIISDPDAFFVTPQLTMDEAEVLMTLDAIMGGLFFCGDKVEDLPQERLDLLKNRRIIEVNKLGDHAVPLDLFSGADVPYVWKLESHGRLFIAVFNWLDKVRSKTYDFQKDFELDGRHYFFDNLWTNEKFEVKNGNLHLDQQPHSVEIYELSMACGNQSDGP